MERGFRQFIASITLFLLSVILVASCCLAGPQMTVEEFARLIGYENAQKISLGTFGDMLDEGEDRLVILLKVDIYRNDKIPSRDEFFAGVDPIVPDETVIAGQIQLARSFVREDEEIFFSYVLERRESVPGYTLHFNVRGQSGVYDIKVPELFSGYVWQSSWPHFDGMTQPQKTEGPVRYFSASAWKGDYANSPSSSLWSPAITEDAGRAANAFHVFVNFSYEIVGWSHFDPEAYKGL